MWVLCAARAQRRGRNAAGVLPVSPGGELRTRLSGEERRPGPRSRGNLMAALQLLRVGQSHRFVPGTRPGRPQAWILFPLLPPTPHLLYGVCLGDGGCCRCWDLAHAPESHPGSWGKRVAVGTANSQRPLIPPPSRWSSGSEGGADTKMKMLDEKYEFRRHVGKVEPLS